MNRRFDLDYLAFAVVAVVVVIAMAIAVIIEFNDSDAQADNQISPYPPTHVEWVQVPITGYNICGADSCIAAPPGALLVYPRLVPGPAPEQKRRTT